MSYPFNLAGLPYISNPSANTRLSFTPPHLFLALLIAFIQSRILIPPVDILILHDAIVELIARPQ